MASMSTFTMIIIITERRAYKLKINYVILNDKIYYYLPDSGNRAENVTLTVNHVTYFFDDNGVGHILR